MRPLVLDIFAGVGGMSLGLEASGFDIFAAIEIDPVHASVHHFNFPYSQTICADVRAYDPQFSVELDLIAFGSPCTPFSSIGLQDPQDPRRDLSLEALRIILKLRPKYFVMENVPSMLRDSHVDVLQHLIEQFESADYKIIRPVTCLNASDFGVPQNRKRLFVIGYRSDCPAPKYPAPAQDKDKPKVIDFIHDLAKIPEFITEDRGLDAEIVRNHIILSGVTIPADFNKCHIRQGRDKIWGHLGSKHQQKIRDRFEQTLQGKKEPISKFSKLDPLGQAPVLRAGTASNRGSHTAPRPIHYKIPRCITAREAARLHGYPDWFQFNRTIWGSHREIGNSVCPPVAKAIGEQIIKVLPKFEPEVKRLPKQDDSLVTFSNSEAARYFKVAPDLNGKRLRKRSK